MLELRWIDAIHARMLVRYGSKWIALFQSVDMELVKADWAEELSGLNGAAIKHGLENLPPEFPPTVAQFKAACLRAPEPEFKRLDAPKADPARVAAELKRMAEMQRGTKPLQWAYTLQERERQGHHLSAAQRASWRLALQGQSDASICGAFAIVPADALPPGMRSDAHTVVREMEMA